MREVRRISALILLCLFWTTAGMAQQLPAQALTNVTIHRADGKVIKSGTVVWRNGLIENAGVRVDIPFDAIVTDGGDSLHVYPGFVDGLALWGTPGAPEKQAKPERPGEPGYERAGIQPQRQPSKIFDPNDQDLAKAHEYGFTTAGIGFDGFMLPGQVDLYFVKGSQTGHALYRPSIAQQASLKPAAGGFGNGAYPATLMGVMARFRQLMFDAQALQQFQHYYASTDADMQVPPHDEVLEALYPILTKDKPLYFVSDSKENIERVLRLQDEFGFDMVLVSAREGYMLKDELARREIPVLASLDLPAKPDWMKEEDQKKKEEVSEEMQHFRDRQEQAWKDRVQNIKALMDAGVKVGYASNGLKLADFHKNLQTLSGEGYGDTVLLKLLTVNTADILGSGKALGDIDRGKVASFTAFTKPFTDKETKAVYAVSEGTLDELTSPNKKD